MSQIQDPQAAQEFSLVLDDLVNSSKVFTAAHVTLEIRKRELPHAGRLAHMATLSPAVRCAFHAGGMPGYDREMMPGGFFAYFPIGEDPYAADLEIPASDWLPPINGTSQATASSASPPAPAPVTMPPTSSTASSVPGNKSVLRGTVADGTTVVRDWSPTSYVEVPKEMLRQAGFSHGDEVMLFSGPDGIVRLINGLTDVDGKVQNARMCLRLWGKAFERVGLDTHRAVHFTFSNQCIEVAVP
jgi:hypothetical protein